MSISNAVFLSVFSGNAYWRGREGLLMRVDLPNCGLQAASLRSIVIRGAGFD